MGKHATLTEMHSTVYNLYTFISHRTHPMTTFADLFNNSPFSPTEFRDNMDKNKKKFKIYTIAYYAFAGIMSLSLGSMVHYTHVMNYLSYYHQPHNNFHDYLAYVLSNGNTCFMSAALIISYAIMPMVPFIIFGMILNVHTTDRWTSKERMTWGQKYEKAWNQQIEPKMLQSITHFQRLTDTLSDSDIASHEYATMYKLSEQVKNTLNNGPILYPNTHFDATPAFVELDTQMEAYNAKRAN